MVNTQIVIEYLRPGAVAGVNYAIENDGSITAWRLPEPQPTPAEILAATPAAQAAWDAQQAQIALNAVEIPAAKIDLKALPQSPEDIRASPDPIIAQAQVIIDAADADEIPVQAVIDGYVAASNADRATMVVNLAKAIKDLIRDGKKVAQEIKKKAQETKDIAQVGRKTIRVIAEN